ncbi:hypothetical protein AURDEDRAFT_111174 [Auricularia subglabra TFB-10046 SS5]|nr:hypothetical protein AURDEDRAFT_111174 [Auricularia subglabra TFB-10046 SS5]
MDPAPPKRRFSEVYVELPRLSPRWSLGTVTSKENQPLPGAPAPKSSNAVGLAKKPSADAVLKEKPKDASNASTGAAAKRKAETTAQPAAATKKLKSSDDNAAYCHQCNRPVPLANIIQCTKLKADKQCRAKYCDRCLKNRYGEDIKVLKTAKIDSDMDASDRRKHVSDTPGYLYECPRCAGCCNCRACRKAAGLQPTGKITVPNGASARDVLEKNPKATAKDMIHVSAGSFAAPPVYPDFRYGPPPHGIVPYAMPHPHVPIRPEVAYRTVAPPKIPRAPQWEPIPTDMSREEVEDRIYLREFILRFGPLLGVAKVHLDVLDDFETLTDATVKALVVALLDLLAVEEEGPHRKILVARVKEIRGAHSPTKIWAVLERLREEGVVDYPDPTQPLDGAGAYNTRRGVVVAQGSQLLPILLSLCERALRSASVRADIEDQERERPQFNRDDLYGPLKELNDAWVQKKKAFVDEKTAPGTDLTAWKIKYREAAAKHQQAIIDVEQAHYEREHAYTQRFRPLGRDYEGRTYYLLSSQRAKKAPTHDERENFKHWSWFVACYGTAKGKDWDEEEERWWGLNSATEIRALSKWLMALAANEEYRKAIGQRDPIVPSSPLSALSADGDDSDDEDEDRMEEDDSGAAARQQMLEYYGPKPTMAEVKSMCKRVDEFAGFLEWKLSKEQK